MMVFHATLITVAIIIMLSASGGPANHVIGRGAINSLVAYTSSVTSRFSQDCINAKTKLERAGRSGAPVDTGRFARLCLTHSSKTPALLLDYAQGSESYYNILSAGSVGNGTSDNTPALVRAIAVAKSAGQGLYIPVGTFKTDNVVISVPVMFAPGASMLKPATGQTVVLSGPITADLSQHFSNALAGQGTVSFAGNSGVKEVFPQWWGAKGDDVHDDTGAIQAAILAYPKAVMLPAATYSVTGTISITQDFSNLRGAGIYSSVLHFNPSSEKPCLDLKSAGRGLISYVNMRDFGLSSTNTVKKEGIRITDGTEIFLENIKINGFNSARKDSIGLQVRGRELQTFRNMTITADIPISVEDDPNTIFDFDHYHFDNLYLIADVTQPCVNVASGVNLSDITFDGYQSWIQGKYGFYYNDSATTTISFALTIRNVRWEQNTDNTGYMIYISHNVNLNGLILENLYGGGEHGKGFYFRKVTKASLRNVQYQGSLEVLNANGSDSKFYFDPASNDLNWPTSAGRPATVSIDGFLDWLGLYGCEGYCFITPLMNNGASRQLLPASGDGAFTRGSLLVNGPGGVTATFEILGANHLTRITGGNSGSDFSTSAGSGSKTNIYWNSVNNRYEIENNTGAAFAYTLRFWADKLH